MAVFLSPVGGVAAQFFDNNGVILSGGKLYTYIAGTTTPAATYTTSSGGTAHTNPIILDSAGRVPGGEIWLTNNTTYKFILKNASDVLIATYDNINGVNDTTALLAYEASVASSSGSSLVGFIQSGVGAVATTAQTKMRQTVNVADFGVASDGTDQTTTLTTYFSANSTYCGVVVIPYGTKFTKSTVYAAVPVGYILVDQSSINTGQPPTYKNKSIRIYTNDTVSDDATFEVASSHHPTIRLNNLHTAGTTSATNYYHSIVRSAGFRWNNDPIDGMQNLTYKSPRGNLWRTSDILNTPYNYAVNATTPWTALTAFTLNTLINTSAGAVWKCATAGTTGTTEPTGTAPYTDGTVVWTYQGLWSAGSTVIYYDEDGYGGINSFSTGISRWGAETSTSSGISINCNSNTGDTFVRDDQRAQDLIRLTTSKGLQLGGVQSIGYGGAISGATPTITSSFHSVNNSSAQNMTGITVTGSQVSAYVTLIFSNGNTTLKAAASNFFLKGNVDVTPVSGQIMCFLRESAISSSTWYEVSRSF